MTFDPNRPYNDLPLLPPKADLESKVVLKKDIAANKALAELKGAGELMPNPGILIQAIGLQGGKRRGICPDMLLRASLYGAI